MKDVAVIGVPSELGEDEVYAVIETAGGQPLDPAELRARGRSAAAWDAAAG